MKSYTSLAEPIAQLYERLQEAGYIAPIPALPVDVHVKWYDPKKICAYHSGMKGHTTEACRSLKDKIQKLIDTITIQLKEPTLNVANNPLPNNQVNMIEGKDTVNLEGSIWSVGQEDVLTTTVLSLITVCMRVSKSAFGKASLTRRKNSWSYDKGKANVGENDVWKKKQTKEYLHRQNKLPTHIAVMSELLW